MGKTIVRKNKVGEPILHAFKAYSKATIIKTMGIKIRSNTENRIESKTDPYIHGQLTSVKGTKATQWKKKLCFNK